MRQHYILDTAATLLGVALVIVTAVHITGKASTTIAADLACGAARRCRVPCGGPPMARVRAADRLERIAERIFGAGLIVLLCSVLSFWF